jgi:hypothetical protein
MNAVAYSSQWSHTRLLQLIYFVISYEIMLIRVEYFYHIRLMSPSFLIKKFELQRNFIPAKASSVFVRVGRCLNLKWL